MTGSDLCAFRVATAEYIFCDFDGTLVDSLPTLRKVFRQFLDDVGIDQTSCRFEDYNGPTLAEVVEQLRSRYSLDLSTGELLDRYEGTVQDAYIADVQPMANASRLLEGAQDRTICLVTSGRRMIVDSKLQALGWTGLFNTVVTADDFARGKPAPDPYLTAMRAVGCSTDHRAFAIEDSPAGARSALAAGLPVAYVGDAISAPTDARLFCTTLDGLTSQLAGREVRV